MSKTDPAAVSSFAAAMRELATWRDSLAGSIVDLREWITAQNVQSEDQLASLNALLEQLQDDKLRLAFVAEFSRGKSELINAMFFSGYAESMLPSSVGTTTQCPTELLYDATEAPYMKLLPIETRELHAPLSAFRDDATAWTRIALDFDDAANVAAAFKHLTETISVRVSQAINYGLYHPDDPARGVSADGTVRVPRWRHAVINYPHPLLKDGLVILDTPGLNAIGTEPELTINLIPESHAVIFVLGIDTGVTKSDLDIWHQCVHAEGSSERVALVALNKIDGLWDDALGEHSREGEITRQIESCAQILSLPKERVLPISAKKALAARTTNDALLLERSRLPRLEAALGSRLIPARRKALHARLAEVTKQVIESTQRTLAARVEDQQAHRDELRALQGKNQQLVTQLSDALERERSANEASDQTLTAAKRLIGTRIEQVFAQTDMAKMREAIDQTRRSLVTTAFSHRMHQNVTALCQGLQDELTSAVTTLDRIRDLVAAQTQLLNRTQAAKLSEPLPFPLHPYVHSIDRLRAQYQQHFQSVLSLLLNRRSTLVTKSFEALAKGLEDVLRYFNRDLRVWSKELLAPINSFASERRKRLDFRTANVHKLTSAGGDLSSTVAQVEAAIRDIETQLQELEYLSGATLRALAVPDVGTRLSRA